MRLRYKHYMHITENELLNRLQKRKLHDSTRAEIIRVVAEQKHILRVQRGKNHQHTRMWEELMTPLKYERKLIASLLKYQGGVERAIALQQYGALLDTTIGKMTLAQRAREFTPYQIAEAANRPNKGVHWTDWITPTKKLAITALFDAIPHKPKAKKKLPFERTIPKTLWQTLHKRLLTRTEKELEVARQKLNASRIEGRADVVERRELTMSNIEQALVWIRDTKECVALPVTWHGYF
jgi:hypothetical protein